MEYSGIISPIITPFRKDGTIDYDATKLLLEFLEISGVEGVFPLGSTGLFPWLNLEEKKSFISHVVENAGKMKVIAGVGSTDISESVSLAQHAKDSGASASVLMPVYYITPSQSWIRKQFSDVIGRVDMDFFIYNIPQLAGSWIGLQTYGALREDNPNIVGAKESSGDMRYFSRVAAMRENGFDVFQGQDDLLLASLTLGASGGVCGLSNFSASVTTLMDQYNAGRTDNARDIQINAINPLIKAVNVIQFPTGYYYAFYKLMSMNGGYRSPMTPPSSHDMSVIDTALSTSQAVLQTYK